MHKSLAMYVVISGYTINYHTHFFQPPCKGIWGRIDKEKGGGGQFLKLFIKRSRAKGYLRRSVLITRAKAVGALLFLSLLGRLALFLLGRSSRRLSAPYCFSPNSYSYSSYSYSYSYSYSMTIFSETTNRRDMVLVPFDRVASKDVRNLKKFRNFALLRKRGSNYAKIYFWLQRPYYSR